MRIITFVSVISLLFVAPFAFAASTETAAPKPTASTMMAPGTPMMDKTSPQMMPSNWDSMMGGTNVNPMMRGKMFNSPLHQFSSYSNPWSMFFCAVTMILGWVLLISVICALWTWIKKQKQIN